MPHTCIICKKPVIQEDVDVLPECCERGDAVPENCVHKECNEKRMESQVHHNIYPTCARCGKECSESYLDNYDSMPMVLFRKDSALYALCLLTNYWNVDPTNIKFPDNNDVAGKPALDFTLPYANAYLKHRNF